MYGEDTNTIAIPIYTVLLYCVIMGQVVIQLKHCILVHISIDYAAVYILVALCTIDILDVII